ncbi:DnaJ domain-containing protein [Hirschfeldia incana]|nr:DnaJ domain-containing protein [Hirschfeldia incana]
MEHNEEDARRAMDIAEKKLSENDYYGAKTFINQAKRLYPNLDGLQQAVIMIDVYISASTGRGREADWYEILGVDHLADDETVKKQYKKLALLLHPDKNKFNGAEGAFKLVLEAWSQLSSDHHQAKHKKTSDHQAKHKNTSDHQAKNKNTSDHQARHKKSGFQKPPKPQEPPSSTKPKPEPRYEPAPPPKPNPKPEPKPRYEPEPTPKFEPTFWTVCSRCKTYCEFLRADYFDKTVSCPNCCRRFIAVEVTPEIVNGRPVIRLSPSQETFPSTSAYDWGKSTSQTHKRLKRWFEPKLESDSDSVPRKEKVSKFTFWTVCNRCKTYCRFARSSYVNKILPCPNCRQDFVANEIIPEVVNGSPVIKLASHFRPTCNSASGASSSTRAPASGSAKAAKTGQESVKYWFGES